MSTIDSAEVMINILPIEDAPILSITDTTIDDNQQRIVNFGQNLYLDFVNVTNIDLMGKAVDLIEIKVEAVMGTLILDILIAENSEVYIINDGVDGEAIHLVGTDKDISYVMSKQFIVYNMADIDKLPTNATSSMEDVVTFRAMNVYSGNTDGHDSAHNNNKENSIQSHIHIPLQVALPDIHPSIIVPSKAVIGNEDELLLLSSNSDDSIISIYSFKSLLGYAENDNSVLSLHASDEGVLSIANTLQTSSSTDDNRLHLHGTFNDINEQLKALTYMPSRDQNMDVQIHLTLTYADKANDGQHDTMVTVSNILGIFLVPVNDPPVISHHSNPERALSSDSIITMASLGLQIKDVDSMTPIGYTASSVVGLDATKGVIVSVELTVTNAAIMIDLDGEVLSLQSLGRDLAINAIDRVYLDTDSDGHDEGTGPVLGMRTLYLHGDINAVQSAMDLLHIYISATSHSQHPTMHIKVSDEGNIGSGDIGVAEQTLVLGTLQHTTQPLSTLFKTYVDGMEGDHTMTIAKMLHVASSADEMLTAFVSDYPTGYVMTMTLECTLRNNSASLCPSFEKDIKPTIPSVRVTHHEDMIIGTSTKGVSRSLSLIGPTQDIFATLSQISIIMQDYYHGVFTVQVSMSSSAVPTGNVAALNGK